MPVKTTGHEERISVMLPVLADCMKLTSSITLKIKRFPEVKFLLELYLNMVTKDGDQKKSW
jgi:hypothetical protein